MFVLLHVALLIRLSNGFFFGTGGSSGCQCVKACPAPVTCAPLPTCAIPLPCPTQISYSAPAPAYQSDYQVSWRNGVPAQYEIPASAPVSTSYQTYSYETPAVSYQHSYQTVSPVYTPTYETATSTYEVVQPVYRTAIPAPTTTYIGPREGSTYTSSVQPTEPAQPASTSDSYQESTQAGGEYPTLTPTYSATSADPYNTDTHLQSITGTSYDEMAPALAPPVPSTTSGFHASPVDYGGSADITDITVQDNEALLRPSTAIEHVSQLYDENGIPIESSAHQPSSHNAIEPWPGSSASRGRISTEGLTPYLKFMKRHWVLKRLRNARQFAAAVPRTNSTCNSQKLSKVMAKVMMDDVTASKRAILKSTELAFDGDKYDVFCANGEFSYSIHSRKYCEVTKNAITCFAFR
ncbi:hypothetical protein V3C99_014304 [Haemonchus contortus]